MFQRLLILVLVLTACGPTTPPPPTRTPTPVVTQTFRDQIEHLIEEGRTLDVLTGLGVKYEVYEKQLAVAREAFELVETAWPTGYAPTVRANFSKAFEGWGLAQELWSLELDEKGNPVEADVNGYSLYVAYAGEHLIIDTFPDDHLNEKYRGKKYIPFANNVGILFAVASQYFINARGEIMARLP